MITFTHYARAYTLQIAGKDPVQISARHIEDIIYVIKKYRKRELAR
jgi:hypothetical protein